MVRPVVFIVSLERSGSTVLDLSLSRKPQFISLGEAARVLMPHGAPLESVYDRPCTCGARAVDCELWGDVLKKISAAPNSSLAERYQILVETFEELYGSERIPVDSSKFLKALDAWIESGVADLSVLSTIRDVRGWVVSVKSAEHRSREVSWRQLLSPDSRKHWKALVRHLLLRKIPFWLPLEWWMRNARIYHYLKVNQLRVHKTSYERVVLGQDAVIEGLFDCDFGSNMPVDQLGEAGATVPKDHIVRGNRMAFGGAGALTMRYDYTWMGDFVANALVVVLFPVLLVNGKWVYGRRSSRTL